MVLPRDALQPADGAAEVPHPDEQRGERLAREDLAELAEADAAEEYGQRYSGSDGRRRLEERVACDDPDHAASLRRGEVMPIAAS